MKWLKCIITPGQFTGEYAVSGKMFDGSEFSLFAPKEKLCFSGKPTSEKPVKGFIHVELSFQKDNLQLVILPRPAFEFGRTITVRKTQLHFDSNMLKEIKQ